MLLYKIFILDVSVGNQYVDSQSLPMLYQNKEFLGLRKGDLVEFNQRIEHALFWDRRIDIAVLWKKIIIKKRYIGAFFSNCALYSI